MENKDNQELLKKYENSKSFAEQMHKISDRFREYEQQAYYM